MNITLVGSKHFGCLALHMLISKSDIVVQRVVVTDREDRLCKLATMLGYDVYIAPNPKLIDSVAILNDCDLIITAYTHARISDAALSLARLGGIGYHPSILPRHKGRHAVEDTIAHGDPIAGGTVYQLTQGWDEGNIVEQDYCLVHADDDAGSLWRLNLSPMGIRLLSTAVDKIVKTGTVHSVPQQKKGGHDA
jgi:methionyl-tRNA formyltransferase